MTSKYVLLLFCALVAAMNDLEPVYKFNDAKTEVWKKLAIEEERVLKFLDEKFNENLEKYDFEMKETLKSSTAKDPKKVINDLVKKLQTDVLKKTFQNYATMDEFTLCKLDYEKIAMQAVKNYYNFMWYFILKRKHPGTNAKEYFFKNMWQFLDSGHRDFGPSYNVPYYKPPIMNREENLKLFQRIESEIPKKYNDLLKKRILNWTVHRYLEQNDGNRLKAVVNHLAEALEKKETSFDIPGISVVEMKKDFGAPYPVSLYEKELEAAMKKFIEELNVHVKSISINGNFIRVYLQS